MYEIRKDYVFFEKEGKREKKDRDRKKEIEVNRNRDRNRARDRDRWRGGGKEEGIKRGKEKDVRTKDEHRK